MIKQLEIKDLCLSTEIIRVNFTTVAVDLGSDEVNCPRFVDFAISREI